MLHLTHNLEVEYEAEISKRCEQIARLKLWRTLTASEKEEARLHKFDEDKLFQATGPTGGRTAHQSDQESLKAMKRLSVQLRYWQRKLKLLHNLRREKTSGGREDDTLVMKKASTDTTGRIAIDCLVDIICVPPPRPEEAAPPKQIETLAEKIADLAAKSQAALMRPVTFAEAISVRRQEAELASFSPTDVHLAFIAFRQNANVVDSEGVAAALSVIRRHRDEQLASLQVEIRTDNAEMDRLRRGPGGGARIDIFQTSIKRKQRNLYRMIRARRLEGPIAFAGR